VGCVPFPVTAPPMSACSRRACLVVAAIVSVAVTGGCARSGSGLAGQWQLSWQGRIGTEQATVVLQTSGQVLQGSFRTSRGSVPLSGSVHGSEVSFAVGFPGPPPYRVLFSGVLHDGRIGGQAQPQDVNGRAFAGHGGEISPEYYTWTAVRAVPKT
jgi:hypothetical protein